MWVSLPIQEGTCSKRHDVVNRDSETSLRPDSEILEGSRAASASAELITLEVVKLHSGHSVGAFVRNSLLRDISAA